MIEYTLCFFLLAIAASVIWVTVLTGVHFFDFSFAPNANPVERLARSLGTAIRQAWFVNNGQWLLFATMTFFALVFALFVQFERPPVITQVQTEIHKNITSTPKAQKAYNWFMHGQARLDTPQEKKEVQQEIQQSETPGFFINLPWFTCAMILLVWTFFYTFFAISDEMAEVIHRLTERVSGRQSAGGRAAEGVGPALRNLWAARQQRAQQTATQLPIQPRRQPGLWTIALTSLGTDFLFEFFEQLWRNLRHRQV